MLVVDSRQEQHMGGNLVCPKERKVIGIELDKQLVNELWWDVWTPLRHFLAQGLLVGQRRGLTGIPHRYPPLLDAEAVCYLALRLAFKGRHENRVGGLCTSYIVLVELIPGGMA